MNRDFLLSFLENTQFPEPARNALLSSADKVNTSILPVLTFYENGYNHEATVPLIQELSHSCQVHEYTLWMLLLILAAEKARPLYKTDRLYWDTFCDLRYKAQECFDVYGIWGTFVAHWYPIFFNGTIVKLGRMEYQIKACPFKEPKTAMGITVNPGDPILALHIPTSFEPFNKEARIESYRKAWEYFCPDGKPLVCVCGSWLLYDGYDEVFAPGSNIDSFRKEFYMLSTKATENFGNAWRVFGNKHSLPVDQLPEKTSLQRAFKVYMQKGGTHGNGTGVIVFDGEKLLSERK